MATVAERRDPGADLGAEVDDQIAQAVTRIRAHDLALGGLLLAAAVLAYAAGMIVLDKALVLPEAARQVGLGGFALVAAGVAYLTLVRPLLRRVNPLYAAVRVERTIEDPKNTVSGYVEARDRGDIPDAVRAAMGARAARSAREADVNRAVDHKSLFVTGAVAVALLLTLIVLFFVFRPTQFTSLLTRAFVPFSSDPIATRTRLDLIDPAGGDVTVTAGQSVTVRVLVDGKVPSADGPDRLRVLLRHTPDGDYEDLPLEPGETSRDWSVRVPETLIRNGVWYKVAGGDGETAEHKVTVRSVPKFTEFEVAYEYPAYVRRPPATATDAHLEGYRGTKVALVGKTNRTVKDGRLTFDPPAREPVAGKPVPGRPDALRWEFTLTDPGSYRLAFTSDEGERAPESPPFGIRVLEDFAPQVEVVDPKEDEVQLPANGSLAVDGRVGDDFGIDRVTLRMRLVEPAERLLAPKPYQGGKSFRREKDGTWPKSLDYKDSADFTKLTDADGKPVGLKADMVLEYWLEATDNRTLPGPTGEPEPAPNVGRSKPKRVRLTPPPAEPERQEKQAERKEKRQAEEQQFQKDQQQKLDDENRDPDKGDPPPQPNEGQKNGDPPPEPKGGQGDPKKQEGGNDVAPKKNEPGKEATPKQGEDTNPPKKNEGDPAGTKKEGQQGTDGGKTGEPKKGDTPPPMNGGQQDQADGGPGKTPEAPPPMPKDRSDLNKKAEELQKQLDQQANNGGEPKPNPDAGADQPPPEPGSKPEPKEGDPSDGPKSEPKGGGQSGSENAGEPKPQRNTPKSDDPATPKPEPKADGSGGQSGDKPADTKPQPKGDGQPAGDKPTPQPKQDPGMPPAKDGQPPKDPAGGGEPKPEPKADGQPNGGAGQPKPMPKAESGDKPPADPMGGGSPEGQPGSTKPEPGKPQPKSAPQPGATKPAPNEPQSPMNGGDASEPKPEPSPGGDPMKGPPGETKPQPKAGGPENGAQQPAGQPAKDKPAPGDNQAAQGQPQPKGSDPGAKGGTGKEPTPQQKKEFEQAVKDLAGNDPQKRDAAQKKLDETVGKENRQQIEDIAKGLNSDKPEDRAAAQKKLEELKDKAGRIANKDGPKGADQTPKGGAGGQKPDPKEVEQALKDLNSKDATAQQAARDKLDKTVGPEARKEAEQLMKDLQSGDKDRREAAEQKLKDMQEKAGQQANKGGGPNKGEPLPGKKPDPAAVEKALNELGSDDAMTREAAKKTLDEQLGKGTGDEAERAEKERTSGDLTKEGQGRKKLEDIQKRAEQMAKAGDPKDKGKGLSPEETAELAKKLDALRSKDDQTRKAAEEAFDQKLGKENRDKLQEALNDPKKADDLRKQLEEMAQKGGGDEPTAAPQAAGPQNPKINPEAVADAKARARSGELQLERFEKNKDNPEFRDRAGMSDAEYDEFLRKYRDEVGRLKHEADELEKAQKLPPPPGGVVNPGGARTLDKGAGPSAAGVGSAGVAPPDARDAMRKFREGAVKVVPKK